MEFAEAVRSQGFALASLVVVASALTVVAGLLFRELKDRIRRAETLTDDMVKAFDALGPATQKSVEVAEAALNELRGKPRSRR